MSVIRLALAQRENWERLGDRFSGKQAELNYEELAMLAAAVVGAGVLIWLLKVASRWQEERASRPDPKRLFNELSRAHQLSRWERRALVALSEAAGVRQPAEAFVRPEIFRLPEAPPEAAERPLALGQLRRKLFPELEMTPAEPGA